jgi:hypothetical protein
MKKILSVFVLCLAFATLTFAQAEEKVDMKAEQVKEQVQGPQITFENKTIDYGVIEQESDPYRVFKFTNSGNEPLVITNAKGSCGCTVPQYSKDPIGPGETGEIKVRYDTKRLGKFIKTVTLTTNQGEEKVVLTIKGEVKKKPAEPAALPAKEVNPFNNNN